ncbi:putative 2-hydroxyacid dehydrogenase [Aspergillus nomiae NRRL 13137]|uniref:Putative 2-hydroxyacid dehydrogenase n=1 Tax=Aspergillus nomiae NRRL (strain ATCC 15546 / NRRL 13137 / CBS 260.88 / M93) TaxID=1509407 RepID=A0A0L1J8Y0_ASPN3|nr:putative 2-hydroxyacid dehydrogenase [Aspergillus nomiae NRRL 13137]KNG88150.1 putative 2-hydroxyacid dehydrogenase [Aspergillus nomiae NRRL 13137]
MSKDNSRELLLVFLPLPEPKEAIDLIRQQFSTIEVAFFEIPPGTLELTDDIIPSDLLQRVTIMTTAFGIVPHPDQTPQLKYLHTFSAGVDHLINRPIFRDTNIRMSTSSGIHGPPIAEWVVMNWLAYSRMYPKILEASSQHRWLTLKEVSQWGVDDNVGQTVGILGYGSIGRQVARVASGLGMRVLVYTAQPRLTAESRKDTGFIIPGTGDPDGLIPEAWYSGRDRSSLHSFLAQGLDHLVVSLPLNTGTTNLIGKEELDIISAHCKSTTQKPFLTNISRGKVLDQDALLSALQSGALGGAALDVTDPEPLPVEHPLWEQPNVNIGSHMSAFGKRYWARSLEILRLNLARIREGQELINEYHRC